MKKLIYSLFALLALASCTETKTENANDVDEAQVLEQVIMARRSIRQYTDQTVSRETLDQLLRCGINAPNGRGLQAYEIRVVDNPETLLQITEAVRTDNPDMKLKQGTDNIFVGATSVIFIANDTSYDMSQVDCGLLGQNIMLEAYALGLGTCCMAHPVRLMKESPSCATFLEQLGFSQSYNLLYAIALGYPAETPDAKPRREDMIKYID